MFFPTFYIFPARETFECGVNAGIIAGVASRALSLPNPTDCESQDPPASSKFPTSHEAERAGVLRTV